MSNRWRKIKAYINKIQHLSANSFTGGSQIVFPEDP